MAVCFLGSQLTSAHSTFSPDPTFSGPQPLKMLFAPAGTKAVCTKHLREKLRETLRSNHTEEKRWRFGV
eukprot:SAG11_NODE_1183_length_5593_cov_7.174190_4_plen_69_part_00